MKRIVGRKTAEEIWFDPAPRGWVVVRLLEFKHPCRGAGEDVRVRITDHSYILITPAASFLEFDGRGTTEKSSRDGISDKEALSLILKYGEEDCPYVIELKRLRTKYRCYPGNRPFRRTR